MFLTIIASSGTFWKMFTIATSSKWKISFESFFSGVVYEEEQFKWQYVQLVAWCFYDFPLRNSFPIPAQSLAHVMGPVMN